MDISLVITTYNRFDTFLYKNLVYYLENPYVKEIIIYDDCSDDYEKLRNYFQNDKIKLYRQDKNIGALKNKITACQVATKEWICLMDSDNFFDISYFEALFDYWNKNGKNENYIYQPQKGFPMQDFTKYIGKVIDKDFWNTLNDECLVNNGNYVFHKSIVKFVEPILNEDINTHAIDVKYMNYYWLKNGVSIVIVPEMYYDHTIHPGSLYITTCKISDKFNSEFNWKII